MKTDDCFFLPSKCVLTWSAGWQDSVGCGPTWRVPACNVPPAHVTAWLFLIQPATKWAIKPSDYVSEVNSIWIIFWTTSTISCEWEYSYLFSLNTAYWLSLYGLSFSRQLLRSCANPPAPFFYTLRTSGKRSNHRLKERNDVLCGWKYQASSIPYTYQSSDWLTDFRVGGKDLIEGVLVLTTEGLFKFQPPIRWKHCLKLG